MGMKHIRRRAVMLLVFALAAVERDAASQVVPAAAGSPFSKSPVVSPLPAAYSVWLPREIDDRAQLKSFLGAFNAFSAADFSGPDGTRAFARSIVVLRREYELLSEQSMVTAARGRDIFARVIGALAKTGDLGGVTELHRSVGLELAHSAMAAAGKPEELRRELLAHIMNVELRHRGGGERFCTYFPNPLSGNLPAGGEARELIIRLAPRLLEESGMTGRSGVLRPECFAAWTASGGA